MQGLMSRLPVLRSGLFLAGLLVACPLYAQAQPESTAEPAPEPVAEPTANTPAAEPTPDSAAPETIPVEPVRNESTATTRVEREAGGDAVQLDVIEVTASKRVKSQREIPGSVGAIRGEKLEKMSAQGLKDYLKLVPGVVYLDQGTEQSLPIIRGISTQTSIGGTGATVGVYLEDMPFSDLFRPLSIPDLNPFDLDRVEILKGPQGTLFGSGAFAGAIRYLVKKPNFGVWEGKLSATYAQTKMGGISPVFAGALNVPIGDAVAFRAVAVERRDGGLYDESSYDNAGREIRNDPNADRLRQRSLRLLGSWQASEDLSISGFYFDQKTHRGGIGLADNPDQATLQNVPFPSPRQNDFGGGNLSIDYDLGWGRLFSSTNRMTKYNYIPTHQEFALAGTVPTQTPPQVFPPPLPSVPALLLPVLTPPEFAFGPGKTDQFEFLALAAQKIDGFTQEVRLSSPEGGDGNWEWLVGASYLSYGLSRFEYTNIGRNKPDPTSFDQLSDADKAESQVAATIDGPSTELSFFGEVTGRLGQYFELTLGARLFRTVLNADTQLCGAQLVALFQTLCRQESFSDEARGVNPKVSLRYIHSRNMQVYVLAAKGFQFGGIQINPPAPGFPESAEQAGFRFGPYKSSDLWNYELGLRTEWLDRRLRFDLTGFYLDWKDLQVAVLVPFLRTPAKFAVVGNVSKAHSEGLEAALEVRPFDGATFSSSAAWISALTDDEFPQPDGTVVASGARLPGTPRFQWANQFAYASSLPYFSSWTGGVSLTHVHLGLAPNEVMPTGTVGGYDTLDANLSLARPGLRFLPEITVGVNNLTDSRAPALHINQSNLTSTGRIDYYHFVTPRTVLLSLAWNF